MDRKTVLKLAELSKIVVSEAEAESFAWEISGVLGMIEKIKSFDGELFTADSVTEFAELREDIPNEDADIAEKIKREKQGSFTAPKVVQ